MREHPGSLIRHAAAAACLFLTLVSSASAQQPDQPVVSPAPDEPAFLPRADFQISGAALEIDDIRFTWDMHVGGSIDVVDYVTGRLGIYLDYEAVLGNEYKLFDPNQGNYTLEANASARIGPDTEVTGIFHHVSRHLSDRPKRFAIAWNLLGGRLLHRFDVGSTSIDVDVEGGAIVQHSYVDYSWIAEGHAQARHPVNTVLSIYGRGAVEWYGVNGDVPARGRQIGGFGEAGLRLKGHGGVMELFAGLERRVDADPLDRMPQHWALAGVRLLSR
jgi:hypothetical protein